MVIIAQNNLHRFSRKKKPSRVDVIAGKIIFPTTSINLTSPSEYATAISIRCSVFVYLLVNYTTTKLLMRVYGVVDRSPTISEIVHEPGVFFSAILRHPNATLVRMCVCVMFALSCADTERSLGIYRLSDDDRRGAHVRRQRRRRLYRGWLHAQVHC